jgi:hypothetical protein
MNKKGVKNKFIVIFVGFLLFLGGMFFVYSSPQTLGHAISEIAPPAGCGSGSSLIWNGNSWICQIVSSGTASLIAGDGLTLTGNTMKVRDCSNGQILKKVGGSWVCSSDDKNSAGDGLALTGNTMKVRDCSNGQILKKVGGSWVCSSDQTSSIPNVDCSSINGGAVIKIQNGVAVCGTVSNEGNDKEGAWYYSDFGSSSCDSECQDIGKSSTSNDYGFICKGSSGDINCEHSGAKCGNSVGEDPNYDYQHYACSLNNDFYGSGYYGSVKACYCI